MKINQRKCSCIGNHKRRTAYSSSNNPVLPRHKLGSSHRQVTHFKILHQGLKIKTVKFISLENILILKPAFSIFLPVSNTSLPCLLTQWLWYSARGEQSHLAILLSSVQIQFSNSRHTCQLCTFPSKAQLKPSPVSHGSKHRHCRCRGWPASMALWDAGPRSSPGQSAPSASAWCPVGEAGGNNGE